MHLNSRLSGRPVRLIFSLCAFSLLGYVGLAELSELMPLAEKSMLLDIARAGRRLVVVGDRGHVLISDDEGVSWRQLIVPTRAMLTGVAFADDKSGWAVGHDGVVLTTLDGGLSWSLQEVAADLDTVFLDVHFLNRSTGFIVGAYGKCLQTGDGGKTWRPIRPTGDELHFNQIASSPDGILYLTGESGTLLASEDQGTTWRTLAVPYEGSLFGLLPLRRTSLLIYGLRGRVFHSDDAGETWTPRSVPVPILIMTGLHLKSDTIVLAGLGGNFFVSRDSGHSYSAWKPSAYTGGVAGLKELTDGSLLVVGEHGVARINLPETVRP